MPQIVYDFPLEIVEDEASGYGDVRQMSREKNQEYEGLGSAGKHNGGLPGLWDTYGCGAGLYRIIWQLAGCGS